MKFLKKAAKKVFKPVKKVFKAIPIEVWIAAAIFFTAGVAAVGFGAFAGVGTFGGFMGAVGNTMAAGGFAMAGSVGIGSGIPAGLAASTGVPAGTTLGTGVLAGKLGAGPLSSSALAQGSPAGFPATAAQQAAITEKAAALGGTTQASAATGGGAAKGGFLTKAAQSVKGLAATDTGKLMLAQGIMGGIDAFMQQRQADKEQKRLQRSNFFGGPMRGGSEDLTGIRFPLFGPQTTQSRSPNPLSGSPAPSVGSPGGLQQPVAEPIASGIFAPGNLSLLDQDQFA